MGSNQQQQSLIYSTPFKILSFLTIAALSIQIIVTFYHDEITGLDVGLREKKEMVADVAAAFQRNVRGRLLSKDKKTNKAEEQQQEEDDKAPHLYPHLEPLPPHKLIPNSKKLITDTLKNKHPTIAGIASILQNFLLDLHQSNHQFSELSQRTHQQQPVRDTVHTEFLRLAKKHLHPLEETYRNQTIFPVREDDSIFVSLASYREHLLDATLRELFSKAEHPDKLFIGAVVQNCFGIESTCKTGLEVVGKNEHGRDMTKVSDAPPDKNGIELFCADASYVRYCNDGHVRVLYVNETESLGPAMARYMASKLWGGEHFFMQVDSHLQFAQGWDESYIHEAKSAKSYPKAILSSYPPGFGGLHKRGGVTPTPGARLCTCEFSTNDIESHIIRINTGAPNSKNTTRPRQIPFVAAGFFFAHGTFLRDVPFDPYLPWCFMGEEIALSMRSWTWGWNIYAPRFNYLSHQYRPGRMGLPKYWESVGRVFQRPGFNTRMMLKLIKRVKFMVGYLDVTRDDVRRIDGDENVLLDLDHYGLGTVRSREDYLKWTGIDFVNRRCQRMNWCDYGELE